jgi:hypothetical protein
MLTRTATTVTHYYSHLLVAIIRLESGTLRVGDMIHICRHTTDFSQKVETLEVNHVPVISETERNRRHRALSFGWSHAIYAGLSIVRLVHRRFDTLDLKEAKALLVEPGD